MARRISSTIADRKKGRIKKPTPMIFRKGDMVQVIAGEDRGKVGKVLQVLPKKNLLIVERVNFVKRHTKPRKQGQQGGILEKEAPVHASNCLLYDSKAQKGVRVAVERHSDGTYERISKASGEPLGSS
jgi:large subunit ribosomal protein L24